MARSRVDDILDNWRSVAERTVIPTAVRHPRTGRSTIPLGMLAVGATIIIGATALSLRGTGPGGEPSAISEASATSTVTPEVPESSSPSIPAASEGTAADQTPSAADATAAKDAIERYTAALVAGDYLTAFSMLAPQTQAQWQSLADYTAERSAYFKTAGDRYTIQVWPSKIGPIDRWLTDEIRPYIDLRHAVLVEVDYPALAMNNAGWEVFIVNPSDSGVEIFQVR